ncbi:MAG: Rne/Rng family ribonuclease [Bacteroidales bacterium]|nr:Rne/Rng family ribonuclease [Bacteroidales bacterium]
MDKELIISVQENEIQIALLEDKQLVELHKEKKNNSFAVGDVVLGKVKKIMPGLNAVFVDINDEKDGFMHYLDLGPQFNSFQKYLKLAMNGDASVRTLDNFNMEPVFEKTGNLSDCMKVGQYLLTQIAKEPISTKGPKLSGDISFAGRYLVLTPFSNKVSISQKIKKSEERSRLRRLIQSIRPNNFGLIVRTVAEGKSVAELDADLRQLLDKWARMTDKLKTVNGPQKIESELGATSALLRDVLTDDFNTIYCDNEGVCNELRDYLRTIAPDKIDIVKHYKMSTPIFEQFGVQRDIRRAFGRIVTIRSGIYLYIEHTEAMHVIDVNSGNHIKAGTGQEDTALQVNIESAKEIARQLRLRDMGGIVIVDFVDMLKPEHRKELFNVMSEEMKKDKARHTILPLSKFGLMQITRQRVRPAIEVDVQEKCPFCDGTGTIKSSMVVVDEIESNLRYLSSSQGEKRLTIMTHPYVQAYLTKGFSSVRRNWQRKYKIRLTVKSVENYNLLEYHFFNSQNEEINM